jgi:hypothetical protein
MSVGFEIDACFCQSGHTAHCTVPYGILYGDPLASLSCLPHERGIKPTSSLAQVAAAASWGCITTVVMIEVAIGVLAISCRVHHA